MNRGSWQALVDQLCGAEYQFGLITAVSRVHRIEFDAGLTDAEIATIEGRFGFQFPPDLREFLQTALPRGPQFPDWRSGDEAALRDWMNLPRHGVLFDVEKKNPAPLETRAIAEPRGESDHFRDEGDQVAAKSHRQRVPRVRNQIGPVESARTS
jgi:hypothetical protein